MSNMSINPNTHTQGTSLETNNFSINKQQNPNKTETPPVLFFDKDTPNYPTLTPPTKKFTAMAMPASLGASILALIQEVSAEQRRITNEQRAMQTELAVEKIHDMADKMKEKAITQLCLGIVTGAISIAQGIGSSAMTIKGMKNIDKEFGAIGQNIELQQARSEATTHLNANIEIFNTSMKGIGGTLDNINKTIGTLYDADIKNQEADLERIRAMSEQLKSLDEALKELIQKAMSTHDNIAQSMNQARTKILG